MCNDKPLTAPRRHDTLWRTMKRLSTTIATCLDKKQSWQSKSGSLVKRGVSISVSATLIAAGSGWVGRRDLTCRRCFSIDSLFRPRVWSSDFFRYPRRHPHMLYDNAWYTPRPSFGHTRREIQPWTTMTTSWEMIMAANGSTWRTTTTKRYALTAGSSRTCSRRGCTDAL